MAEKTRYSDEELEEFRQIILNKLDKAKKDYEILKSSITHEESNDTMDTSPTFKVLEEGATTLIQRGSRQACTASAEIHSASAGCTCTYREQDLWYLPRDRKADLQGEAARCTACNAVYGCEDETEVRPV